MRIVCWQTILIKYHTLFFSKIRKDVPKFCRLVQSWLALKGFYFFYYMSVVHFPAHIMQNVESCSWKILETCTELLSSISIWQQEYDAWFPATCERVLSAMMFRCCTWLYRFLIFAPLLPLIIRVVLPVLHGGPKKSPRALIIPIPRIQSPAIGFLLLHYSVLFTVSPYLCFISLLYLDLYVLGDDALIS